MSLSRAQNIFMPKNINSITIIITFGGTGKIKTEKMTTKYSEQLRERLQVKWILFSFNENTPSSEAGKNFQNLAIRVFKSFKRHRTTV